MNRVETLKLYKRLIAYSRTLKLTDKEYFCNRIRLDLIIFYFCKMNRNLMISLWKLYLAKNELPYPLSYELYSHFQRRVLQDSLFQTGAAKRLQEGRIPAGVEKICLIAEKMTANPEFCVLGIEGSANKIGVIVKLVFFFKDSYIFLLKSSIFPLI